MRKSTIQTGDKFGMLTAIDIIGLASSGGYYWLLKCDCGNDHVAKSGFARHLISCGCSRRTHGHTSYGKYTPTYISWRAMISRCYNPADDSFARYGGRNIKVCDRWRYGDGVSTGVELFIRDMGERPEGTTIDRINNFEGYHPTNCRWATAKEQAANKIEKIEGEKHPRAKINREIAEQIRLLDGVMSLKQIAFNYGVSKKTVLNIIHGKIWTCARGKTRPAYSKPSLDSLRSGKLTVADVRAIKQMMATSTDSQIAAKFGVIRQTINCIRTGKTWRDVE